MSKVFKIIFIFISAATLGSCIGGTPSIVTTASAPQIMNSFSSEVLGKLPRGNSAAALPSLGGGGISTSAVNAKVAPFSCYSSTPTTPVDADLDGIALLKEYTFDCSDFGSGGFTYNHQGTLKITDKDDSVAGLVGGYRYEFKMPQWYYKNNTSGLSAGGSYSGFWEGSGTATSSIFNSDYTGSTYGEYDITGFGKGDYNYIFSYTYNTVITHDSVAASANWNTGTINASGTYAWNGKFLSESETSPGNYEFKIVDGAASMSWQMSNVVFDHACTIWYKSGKVRLVDVGGNVIETIFACTTAKTYLNGKEIDGVTW